MPELMDAGVAELAASLEAGTLSPVDLLAACLDRIDRLNPQLNALTALDREGALASAQASRDRQRARTRRGPLDGIPVSVKDNLFVRGLPATWGSRLFADHVAGQDDIWVTRLREAGAVIVGKSNTPELALGSMTDNRLFGATRNPRCPTHTPGGSSGGAAASVASGMVPLGIGTDAGGSIRLPASFTGVVGLKPSTGRVPRLFGFPALIADFQAIGLLGRRVADVRLALDVMAGPDVRDRASLAFAAGATVPDPCDWRIGVVESIQGVPMEPEVLDAVRDAADRATRSGLAAQRTSAPFDLLEMMRFWPTLSSVGVARALKGFPESALADVTDPVAALARSGSTVTGIQYADALDMLAAFRAQVAVNFAAQDILLTPTSPLLPWRVGEAPPQRVAGVETNTRTALAFNTFANATGYPAISLPWGANSDGLPIGIQLVAGFGQEALLLAVAERFEQLSPWSTTLCSSSAPSMP